LCILASVGAACTSGSADAASDAVVRARQDSINRATPGYVVDSVRPIGEEIRRFEQAVGGGKVTALRHASGSREALVRRIVADVAKRDSIDLAEAAITPREFIDLVYPTSPYTHAPYLQPPSLVWMAIANPSVAGYRRLLARRGVQSFDYVSHACSGRTEHQSRNTIYSGCTVTVRDAAGKQTSQRWFAGILERDGQFKLVGYKNQF
jgi:hypothetical protein